MSAPDPFDLPDLPAAVDGPVFAAPWEARAFALTVQLHARGAFTWGEWAETLAKRLKEAGPEDDGSCYYEHWLAALEQVVTTKRLADANALLARKQAL